MSFANKVAIVTGASSGIGAAVALKLSAEGAKVAIVGRNEEKLKSVSDNCEKSGYRPLTIIADVSKEENTQRIVSDTLKYYKKLDVLINNAGIGSVTGVLSKNAMQVFDSVMTTNLRSVIQLTNLAGPYLADTKGNIVNISSIAGIDPLQSTGFAYNVSKAGLDHFTRSIANELGRLGIRVNGINPGPVATDILQNMGMSKVEEDKLFEMMKKSTVLQRISDPEEIADLVVFLASDKARGITGVSYVVDNGLLVK